MIKTYGLLANLIIYFIITLPIIVISFNKSNYISKKNLLKSLIITTIIEILLSICLYSFSRNIFSLFIKTSGVINYAVYASKILFITSSLYGIKYLIPIYLLKNSHKKNTTILLISKIVVNIFFILIGYFLFSTKGILFSFPLCDLIYYIIYIYIFAKL